MSLQSDLQKLFGGGSLGAPFGQTNHIGDLPHNGVDWIMPAGTVVKAPIAGTVVVNQGPTIAVQTAGGQILSFWHVIPNAALAVGSKIKSGTQLGTIDYMTGWPYYRGGYAAYSSTPHLHVAVDSSVAGAKSDTGGINPAAFISQLAAGATPATSATSTANAAPTPTPKPSTTPVPAPKAAAQPNNSVPTSSSGTSWITDGWNAVVTAATGSSLKPPASAGTDTSPGGAVNTATSDVSAWSQGLDNQAASALKAFVTGLLPSWVKDIPKYAMIAVLAIVGLLIFLEIFKPGMEQEAMKAAPYVK